MMYSEIPHKQCQRRGGLYVNQVNADFTHTLIFLEVVGIHLVVDSIDKESLSAFDSIDMEPHFALTDDRE
jgi:hypothetical protein